MTAAPQLRAGEPRDLPGLLALAEAFYREDGFTTLGSELRSNLERLLDSPAARVAVLDARPDLLGFAITTSSFGLQTGLVAELEDLYLVPRARRRGLGDLLINDSSDWAAARGCRYLELVVAPNGQDVSSLQRYYQLHGFHDGGRRLLRKPLDAASDQR